MKMSEFFVISIYYVYWILIILSPIFIGYTSFLFLRNKSTIKRRKVFLILSILLIVLDVYQFVGYRYQRQQWENVEEIDSE